MTIKHIQHCTLVVSDRERSIRFYKSALGLVQIPRPNTFTFSGAWFLSGASEIHLIAADDTTAPPGMGDPGPGEVTGLATHFAFEVTDLAAMQARLEDHGAELSGGPTARGDGFMQIWLLDPDGHMLEFFQWKESDQEDAPERGPIRNV